MDTQAASPNPVVRLLSAARRYARAEEAQAAKPVGTGGGPWPDPVLREYCEATAELCEAARAFGG